MTPVWLEALSQPQAYPQRPDHVERLQTHISWLFFAGETVYKLKKPVDFGFVDYTRLARRRHYCDEEVRLNRRLAPDTYLGVQPVVRRADGQISIGGAGEILDYAVQMRRLPAAGMLQALLPEPGLDEAALEQLTTVLVDFHARAQRGPQVARHARPEAIWQLIEDNFTATGPLLNRHLPDALHARLYQCARQQFAQIESQLAHRAGSSHIVDGHGDLHAGNICFTDAGIVIYDCVEFSPALRCADIACDLAFLTMDLEHAGCWSLADRLCAGYARRSGDAELPALVDFYQNYRAMVRCKVAALRGQQPGDPIAAQQAVAEACSYARLALTYALQPVLILCCGLPGSGKTHLSRELARQLGLQRLSSDELRPPGAAAPGYDQGRYSPDQRDSLYRQLAERAAAGLAGGQSVIVDASCARRVWRQQLAEVAISAGRPWLLLELEAPAALIRERLQARQARGEDRSEADFAVYRAAAAQREPPDELAPPHYLQCTSPADVRTLAAAIQDRLLQQ